MDQLKSAVKVIADVLSLVSALMGGFSFSLLGQAIALMGEIGPALSAVPLDVKAWSQMTDADRNDMIAFTSANVKFPANAKVEEVAQWLVESVIALSKVYQLIFGVPV